MWCLQALIGCSFLFLFNQPWHLCDRLIFETKQHSQGYFSHTSVLLFLLYELQSQMVLSLLLAACWISGWQPLKAKVLLSFICHPLQNAAPSERPTFKVPKHTNHRWGVICVRWKLCLAQRCLGVRGIFVCFLSGRYFFPSAVIIKESTEIHLKKAGPILLH